MITHHDLGFWAFVVCAHTYVAAGNLVMGIVMAVFAAIASVLGYLANRH